MRLTRRGRLTITLSVLTVLLLALTYVVTQTPAGNVLGLSPKPPCVITVDGHEEMWSFQTAMSATTVAAVGESLGANVEAVGAALDRALTSDVEVDVAAARAIYQRLPDPPVPAPGSAALARALLGSSGPALTCTVPMLNLGKRTGDTLPREDPGELGLTPRADKVRIAMREVFGKQMLGGFSPAGVSSGHIEGSAHYEGRAVDVFFRPVSAENTRRGWLLAQWLAARAEKLTLATIIFDQRIWTARQSVRGWRNYQHPDGPTTNPILLHKDHVHVDVREGG